MGLIYDPRKLLRVTTTRPEVARCYKWYQSPTLAFSRARMSQLRMIQWHMRQRCEYICMMCGSSGRDMLLYI
jgi:hypothetical protein